ncbi:MAG: FtsW/RodA/SpoVE family cell cycle protein [Paludibacter sp.]|nr:FtsW/RodA/SpoVE family cell cycle protein [Paludibacter sp.]
MRRFLKNIFNKIKNIFGGDSVIWFVFFALCIVSVLEYYSASSQLVFRQPSGYMRPIMEHIMFLLAGLVVVLVVLRIPVWVIRHLGTLGILVSLALLIWMHFKGVISNDAARSMTFFGLFEFQPAELAKLSLVIFAANMLSRIKNPQEDEKKIFWWLMAISGTICALIFKDGLSTSVLLFLIVMILCFIQNIAWKRIGTVLLALSAAIAIILTIAWIAPNHLPTFLRRASTWVNRLKGVSEIDGFQGKSIRPNKDYITEKGDTIRYDSYYYYYFKSKGDSVLYQLYDGKIRYRYKIEIDKNGNEKKVAPKPRDISNRQIMNSKIAITRSIIGTFPGNSNQRDNLSKIYSDFIFAIIIEETGLLGGGFVIVLYLILLIRAVMIAKSGSQVFHALIVFGASLIIVIQALIHMMVVTAIVPVTGQPLPLISSGGTSAIVTSVYFGILLRVTRQIKDERRKINNISQTTDESQQEEIEIDD